MAGRDEKTFGTRMALPLSGKRIPAVARSTPIPSALRQAMLPSAPSQNRLAGLDILRLFAAFVVVMFHYGYAGPTRGMMHTAFPAIAEPSKYGFLGVDLFFLISGFVITGSAYGRTWREFAVSRFLRLYPAYVTCMTISAVVFVLLGASTVVTPKLWLANLTMFAPAAGQPFMDGAYWTIVIEILFYGWVALFVAAGLFERRLMTILTVWLAIAFVNESFFQFKPIRLTLCTEYAAMFASGILFQRFMSGERRTIAWLLLGFAFGLGAMHAFEQQRIFARLYDDTVSLNLLFALHAVIYAVFLVGVTSSRWIPATRTVVTIGALTYPLYLVHQMAGYAVIDALAPAIGPPAAFAAAVGLALLVAYAVSQAVEPAARRTLRPLLNRLAASTWSPWSIFPQTR